MFVIIGAACLIGMCTSILIFASYPISQYNKRHSTKTDVEKNTKDYYSLLFDVYGETKI